MSEYAKKEVTNIVKGWLEDQQRGAHSMLRNFSPAELANAGIGMDDIQMALEASKEELNYVLSWLQFMDVKRVMIESDAPSPLEMLEMHAERCTRSPIGDVRKEGKKVLRWCKKQAEKAQFERV